MPAPTAAPENKLIDELERSGWQVIGLSRRGGASRPGVRYLAVDLHDRKATMAALADLPVSHLFYAAYQHADSWAGLVEPNLAMLDNVLSAAEQSPRLVHVSLMQGYKVYGAHLGPFKTPAREKRCGAYAPGVQRGAADAAGSASAGNKLALDGVTPVGRGRVIHR
nr:NAD-dependent epimerase/dehydratase family protein [Raoultella sp. NCTC 9187]